MKISFDDEILSIGNYLEERIKNSAVKQYLWVLSNLKCNE
jgi:hypothetical protein